MHGHAAHTGKPVHTWKFCAAGGPLTEKTDASVCPVQGPFDAAFFNAVFGNVYDQREALLRACLLLKPGDSPLNYVPIHVCSTQRRWLRH